MNERVVPIPQQFLRKGEELADVKERLYERLQDRRELHSQSKKKLTCYDSYQSGQFDARENCWTEEIEFLQNLIDIIERS
jgi:hypothetical protein